MLLWFILSDTDILAQFLCRISMGLSLPLAITSTFLVWLQLHIFVPYSIIGVRLAQCHQGDVLSCRDAIFNLVGDLVIYAY